MGEVQVSGGSATFTVKRTAPLVFTGNVIDGEEEAQALIDITRKLSTNPTIGRRIGLILFDPEMERAKDENKYNFDIWNSPGSPLYRMKHIWQSLVEEVRDTVKTFHNKETVREWVSKKDPQYEEEGLNQLEGKGHELENEEFFKEFFKGQIRVRTAALNCAIVDFLPRFLSKEVLDKEELIEKVKTRAEEEYLPDFERINLESLDRIIESEKLKEEVRKRVVKTLPKYVKGIVLAATRHFQEEEATPKDQVFLKELGSYYYGEFETYDNFGRVQAKVKESTGERYNPTLRKLRLCLEPENEN